MNRLNIRTRFVLLWLALVAGFLVFFQIIGR
jgi:hypothetical protein